MKKTKLIIASIILYLPFLFSVFILSNFLISDAHARNTKASINSYYIDYYKNDIRVTFTTSKDIKYKIFTLSSPDRIIIDIPNSKWKADSNAKGVMPNVIKKIRTGTPDKNILRIVFDLKSNVKIKSHFYSNNRLGFIFRPKNSNFLTTKNYHNNKKPRSTKLSTKTPISLSKSYKMQKDSPFNLPAFKTKKIPSYKNSILKNNKHYKKPKRHRKPTIIIDAGHGGKDPGAIGKGRTKEKYITLSYALELTKILSKSGKYKIYLTRSNDKYLSLNSRVKRARKAGGDIMLSLHADSHPNSKTKGLSVYTLSDKRAKREANKLINKARKEEVIMGLDLSKESNDISSALISMTQQDTKNKSALLAKILIKELSKDVKLLRNTHRLASLAVLTGADIPSTLIELGYLSNRQEEKQLNNKKYREKVAKAIKRAIDIYFKNYI